MELLFYHLVNPLAVCNIFIIIILTIFVLEDFKYRGILWVWYLLLLFLLIYKAYVLVSKDEIMEGIKINILFILIQIIFIWIYLIIKTKSIINPLKNYIGLGDVVLWIILCIAFSPINFIMFHSLSLIVVSILHLVLKNLPFYNNKNTIPLAGYQSCFLIILIFLEIYFDFTFYNNLSLIRYSL